jgi:hypothetical protein
LMLALVPLETKPVAGASSGVTEGETAPQSRPSHVSLSLR